ncbi:MAG: hypothetical protein ACQEW9_08685 [Bacteroidota bacterium]
MKRILIIIIRKLLLKNRILIDRLSMKIENQTALKGEPDKNEINHSFPEEPFTTKKLKASLISGK